MTEKNFFDISSAESIEVSGGGGGGGVKHVSGDKGNHAIDNPESG